MNKIFLLSFGLALLLVFVIGLYIPAKADCCAYHVVSEYNSTYAYQYGAYTYDYTLGYSGNAKWGYNDTSAPANRTAIWYCKSSDIFTQNYYWHFYVAVPLQGGILDGSYTYNVYNTAETFSQPVNQENFADEWAYLGYAEGKGATVASGNCRVSVNNLNAGGTPQRQFWVDAVEYWPGTSVTPPQYRHDFESPWITH